MLRNNPQTQKEKETFFPMDRMILLLFRFWQNIRVPPDKKIPAAGTGILANLPTTL
jgi:hypothetical protein